MNILFTICGRAGSKGISNKNIMDFSGYPLPLYTVSAVDLFIKKNRSYQYDVVINSDSKELLNIVTGVKSITVESIKRDTSLGLDDTPKIAVIKNSLEEMQKRKNTQYDMVVDLDITSPLRTVQDIETLVKKKIECRADVVFSVTDSRRNPYFNMVKKTEEGYQRVISSDFNTRQEAPEIYDMNASLYAYSPTFLNKGLNIFEGSCDVIKMFDTAVLDLDHKTDYELMLVIAEHLFKKQENFGEIKNNIELLNSFMLN